ncbi:hypothetical protein JX265_014054, partial [Neoarthrinium moseri]
MASEYQLGQMKDDCLRSLAVPAIDARRDNIAFAYSGTCDWLFATPEFLEWQNPTNVPAHNGVLWIKGKPGAGKSTLVKHIYIRCQEYFFRNHVILTYFFNARGETLEKTPLGMLRSILYQLIQNDDALYGRFVTSFRDKQAIGLSNNVQWSESELQEFVRSAFQSRRSQPHLILIDALDECNEADVHRVVTLMEALCTSATWDEAPLRICLSSCHHPRIKMNKHLELTVEEIPDHETDIAKYLGGELRVRDTDMEAEIRKRANGLFLWVVIVVSLLNKAYDEGQVEAMRATLKKIPSDLERLSLSISSKKASGRAEALVILQWVLLSLRPLNSRELFAAVVKTTPPDRDSIQKWIAISCKGLVELRKGEGEGESIQFIHPSVGDFLVRQKRLQALDPTLGLAPLTTIHGRLWATCWASIQEVDTSITSLDGMRTLKVREPFLGYAASFIFDHAEKALSEEGIMQSNRELEHDDGQDTATEGTWPTTIRQWLQGTGSWFEWWKSFLIATGSVDEQSELKYEEEAKLVYVLALRGLQNLARAVLQVADVNAQGGEFGNALQVASCRGDHDMVQLLLNNGAEVNAEGGYY